MNEILYRLTVARNLIAGSPTSMDNLVSQGFSYSEAAAYVSCLQFLGLVEHTNNWSRPLTYLGPVRGDINIPGFDPPAPGDAGSPVPVGPKVPGDAGGALVDAFAAWDV